MQLNTITLKEWSTLFTDVFGDNGKIALCYFLTSIYRKKVIEEFGFFPLLYAYGGPASGKSSLGFHFNDLSDTNQMNYRLSLAAVSASHFRWILGFNNYKGILNIDEFYNAQPEVKTQLLISAYDIHFASKVTGDETKAKEVKSIVKKAIYFCGQEPIANERLAERSIMLKMKEGGVFSESERESHYVLRQIPAENLLRMKRRIVSPFFENPLLKIMSHFENNSREIELKLEVNVSARIICHYAILLTIYDYVGLRNEVPFCHAQMLDVFVDKITEQAEAMKTFPINNQK